MKFLFGILFRSLRKVANFSQDTLSLIWARIVLLGNGVILSKGLQSKGCPKVNVWRKGTMIVGENFSMNNGGRHNLIGRQQPCIFVVADHAELRIGKNVGLSATSIICHNKIVIGDNVKIGGNTVLYDTDFHSITPAHRNDPVSDKSQTTTRPIIIGNSVFVGAHSTILKGVTIGDNAVIGAGSVVTKSIPANQIWAGNPAKFIRVL